MSAINCTALMAFTRFVSGYGMVHGDPDNKDAKKPLIPEHAIARFVEDGLIKAPKGFQTEAPVEPVEPASEPAPEDAPPADDSEDGAPV